VTNITAEMIDTLNPRMRRLHQAKPQEVKRPLCIKTGDKNMEATAPTAREQFVHDFTLVVDNNSEAYFETIDLVRMKKESVPAISEAMREVFEHQISKALLVLRQSEEVEAITADLMHELLLGWGSDVFDDIARHYIQKDGE
jgi:hypothetical protein